MVKTKPIDQVQANYQTGAANAPARYQAGVATADWQTPAASQGAQDRYVQAVTDPARQALRMRHIQAVSNSTWQQQAKTVGGARIGPGMTANIGKYAAAEAKNLAVIQGVNLPDKTSDVASNVANRVTPIAVALRNAKLQS